MTSAGKLVLGLSLVASLLSQTHGEGRLDVATLTESQADVVYTDLSTDKGLRVASALDSLFITTLDGQNLVAAEETVSSMRLIGLGRCQFIQVKTGAGLSRDFAVPEAFSGVLNNKDQAVLRDLVNILNTSGSSQDQDSRLWEAVHDVLAYPEVLLLKSTVSAMGKNGVTGLLYPSVLPFYIAALRLDQLIQRNNLTSHAPGQYSGVSEDCLSECPPCPYQECLGLCGYGCHCWKYVCGDCCYHLGCYEHDICCREKFVRTACLFPFGFKCESGYNCN